MSASEKAQVQSQFGKSAPAYVTSRDHAGGDDLDRLLEWAGGQTWSRALDLATGGGHTARAIARLTRRVVAADLTVPMLSAAREFIRETGIENVTFVAGDAEGLPFQNESFDLVTCRIAPHHFSDVPLAVSEVGRVLKPGGSFLLVDILGRDDPELAAFITEVERRRDPTHVRAYRKPEWKAFLRAAGLTVIDEAVVAKVRQREDWCARTRVPAQAKAELERFVRAAPAHLLEAFAFRIEDGRISAFTDRMLLMRGERSGTRTGPPR